MSFRRSDDDYPGGSRWRAKNRSRLVEAGIPDRLLSSDRILTYVLLHGHDEHGWDSSQLTTEQASRLLEVLRETIEEPTGYELVSDLERRLAGRD